MRTVIRTCDLRPGMTIVRLDIPWEQSPFLTETFRVSDSDLDILTHMGSRYVEIEDGLLPPRDTSTPLLSPSHTHSVRLPEELPAAKQLYRETCDVVREAETSPRCGHPLNIETIRRTVRHIIRSLARNNDALTQLLTLHRHDPYTYLHSVNVGILSLAIGQRLHLPDHDLYHLGIGALLHDIGKSVIPLEVLNKPGRFTKQEYDLVKQHPETGAEILSRVSGLSDPILCPCLEHQERGDGTGYPYRKTLSQTSLFGLITQVADMYDAISSDRVYHKAQPPADVLRYLYTLAQRHIVDSHIVGLFTAHIGLYPVGSTVLLTTGERARVLETNPENLLAPLVELLTPAARLILNLSDPDLIPPRQVAQVLILPVSSSHLVKTPQPGYGFPQTHHATIPYSPHLPPTGLPGSLHP